MAEEAWENMGEGCIYIPEETFDASEYVYFIGAGFQKRGAIVKIGYSSDPDARLALLQTSHHEPLEIVALIHGGTTKLETEIHRHFRKQRKLGEWFRVNPEIRALVSALQTCDPADSSAICEELLESNWLTEKEGFEPSFDAKAHSHWAVLQRPKSASVGTALNSGILRMLSARACIRNGSGNPANAPCRRRLPMTWSGEFESPTPSPISREEIPA